MKKQTMQKPTSVDINVYGQQNIHYTIVTTLEKKYPGHDFAVFGKRLYIDDKDIPFQYNDDQIASLPTILTQVESEVAKLV